MFQDFYPHENFWHLSEIGDINYPFIVGIMGDWNYVIRNGLLGGATSTPANAVIFSILDTAGQTVWAATQPNHQDRWQWRAVRQQ